MRQIVEGFEDTDTPAIEIWDQEGDPVSQDERDVMFLQEWPDSGNVIEIDKRQARALISALQDFCGR